MDIYQIEYSRNPGTMWTNLKTADPTDKEQFTSLYDWCKSMSNYHFSDASDLASLDSDLPALVPITNFNISDIPDISVTNPATFDRRARNRGSENNKMEEADFRRWGYDIDGGYTILNRKAQPELPDKLQAVINKFDMKDPKIRYDVQMPGQCFYWHIDAFGGMLTRIEDPEFSRGNFEINKYDVVGIIGKSGSGKTTLVNILMGLLSPSKGKIEVDEIDISKNIKGWQKNLFLVQQDNYMFDDTIKKNIILGLNEENINYDRYHESIQDAVLKDFINSLPEKDNTITGEDGIKISGGQKQRLSIARALYHNPEVLVLDEATSSLDLETENEILSSLNNIKGKKTIFIISHRESSLKLCNKIIRL